MVERIFLGWDKPFADLVADWLINQDTPLEESLVVVPTNQSARQLRHLMAEKRGALLAPKFSTPGGLMRETHPDIAPNWLETYAWQEVLESQAPQSVLEDLFNQSTPPQESAEWAGGMASEWAGGMASEMISLRRSLQDNALSIRDVARRLSSSPESKRWDALARIEAMVEAWIAKQGMRSRTQALQGDTSLPSDIRLIVLAGISELPPLIETRLHASTLPIRSLIAAPEDLKKLFSEIGTPTEEWNQQALSWPNECGSVQVVTDPRAQAHQARILAAVAATKVDDLALGTADTEVGDFIASEFSTAGWPTHHPASTVPNCGLRHWLHIWCRWLNQADLSAMMELLCSPYTKALIETDCGKIATSLSRLRDQWMVMRPEDLRHQIRHVDHKRLKGEAVEVIRACEKLEQWRKLCEDAKKSDALRHLLDALKPNENEVVDLLEWLQEASDLMNTSARSMSFWIELMLADLAKPLAKPPADRVLDVHGWLELLFQPGNHLILCGLNEGKIPATSSDDVWLGESARALLGLHTSKLRAARDAFLLQSLVLSRTLSGGRVDLICSRANARGEPQLPSRLLLAAKPEETAHRVELLFKELEPEDVKLRWEAEPAALWNPPTAELPKFLNATSFRDYLACPFRYSLKHVLRMHDSDPNRIEWNARDFGNVIHNTLESWGRDQSARELTSADDINHWLNQHLDSLVQTTFNHRIPLAVRIQLDSIRQRLSWFAQCQELLIGESWQVMEVEHQFEIPIGQSTVRAKIDRIDRHADTGEMRIIDYKTGGKADSPASAHRSRLNANSKLPAHIGEDDSPVHVRSDGKKTTTYLWRDLQLPLYALAIQRRDQQLVTPCYFKLGETRSEIALQAWQDFDQQDLEAAQACALWVSERIEARQFRPIAQKVTYDDYELLWCSHTSEEVVNQA